MAVQYTAGYPSNDPTEEIKKEGLKQDTATEHGTTAFYGTTKDFPTTTYPTTTTTLATRTTTTTTPAPTTTPHCSSSWIEFQGYCYRHFNNINSYLPDWTDADFYCLNKERAHLASVHSLEEDTFLKFLSQGEDYWIGGNYLGANNLFFWSDGSPLDYENFSKAKWVYQSFQQGMDIWAMDYCTGTRKSFICKKKM